MRLVCVVPWRSMVDGVSLKAPQITSFQNNQPAAFLLGEPVGSLPS